MNDYTMNDRLQIATEMVRHNKNTMEKIRDAYKNGRCGPENLKAAMACTQVAIDATRKLMSQYIRITERRFKR